MQWLSPTPEDVKVLLASSIADAVTQDDQQVGRILQLAVFRVRGAIFGAGQVPLDQDPSNVPPEGLRHTIVLAATDLLRNTSVPEYIAKEWDKSVREANAWLTAVSEGGAVSYPENPDSTPTGYRMPVRWGSIDIEDMATDVSGS